MMIQYHDGQHNPQVGNTDETAFDKAVDLISFWFIISSQHLLRVESMTNILKEQFERIDFVPLLRLAIFSLFTGQLH